MATALLTFFCYCLDILRRFSQWLRSRLNHRGSFSRQNMHLDVYGVLYTPELCRLGQLALAQQHILVKLGTLVGSMTSTVFSSENNIYIYISYDIYIYVYTTHVYTLYTYILVILYIYIPMNKIKYVHPRIYIGG